jgi:hypothetical protein
MICANLDRLEVYVGGEHFATLTPDTARYPGLDYPPSFADFSTVDGSSLPELRIDSYLGSVRVASRALACDPSGDVLALAAPMASSRVSQASVMTTGAKTSSQYRDRPRSTWDSTVGVMTASRRVPPVCRTAPLATGKVTLVTRYTNLIT